MSETFQFQAETQQLLNLMIHSLYSNKEIFLRELISNSSDALDRLRFEALSDDGPDLGDEELAIRIEADADARTLTIRDNGIGMSRDEVIENIGTIARSGTRALIDQMKAEQAKAKKKTKKKAETGDAGGGDELSSLIGQFGVGFYSSFMGADKVVLVTRRAGDTVATRWESAGDGQYTLSETSKARRGTTITLHLKDADPDNGLEDFTQEWTLKRVIKRYSDFVTYPIKLKTTREEPVKDEEGNEKEGETETIVEETTVNSRTPVWTKSESEVSDDEYAEFYKHISHDWNPPMERIVMRAEGRIEYRALLFVPSKAPYDLFYVGHEPGLQLYVNRVMIMERSADLLPRYLRFIKGVVESPDLPLNVSREMLQNDRHIVAIRKGLVKKVLSTFTEMKDSRLDDYRKVWDEFGRAMKEGVADDWENKDKLTELLLFASSNDPESPTDLAGYLSRMKDGQDSIFYLTGESREQIENSPHLEAFKAKGYEVLYLVDPVDELLVQQLTEYKEKKLKSVGKGEIDLGTEEEREETKKKLDEKKDEFEGFMEQLQKLLDKHIKHVRLSNRLTESPACLVGAEHDYSPQLEKLLQVGPEDNPKQRRILELNPDHEVVSKIRSRFEAVAPAADETETADDAEAAAQADGETKTKTKPKKKAKSKAKGKAAEADAAALDDFAHLLFGYALLAEGSEIVEPVRFNRALVDLMAKAV